MKASFCLTCMNRRRFIEQTLPHNLALANDPSSYEFVLLDYNSGDDLEGYVRAHHADAIRCGLLAYFRTTAAEHFCASHAKNSSHKLATGDILINLDADNLLVPAYFGYIDALQPRELLRTTGDYHLNGRLGLYRDDFEAVGGYDEAMTHGWGGEDDDLVGRCSALGFAMRFVDASESGIHIAHSDGERVRNCAVREKGVSWRMNREISSANFARGVFIANQGRAWGECPVTRNFETAETEIGAPMAAPRRAVPVLR
jgi:glycosyltransferase involved in cell wall biosynthesis